MYYANSKEFRNMFNQGLFSKRVRAFQYKHIVFGDYFNDLGGQHPFIKSKHR